MKNKILPYSIIGITLGCVISSCADRNNSEDNTNDKQQISQLQASNVYTNWDASMAQTKEYMNGCILVKEDADYLKFSDKDKTTAVAYMFSNDRLMAATLIAPKTTTININTLLDDFSYLGDLESKPIYYNSFNTICVPYEKVIDGIENSIVGFTPIKSDLYEKLDPIFVTTGDSVETKTSSVVIRGFVSGINKSCTCGARLSTYEDLRSPRTLSMTSSNGEISVTFSGLSRNTLYYYQCYAKVDGIEYTGEILSFKIVDVSQ